ncbi:MAG: hypothetical protein ABFR75_09785 [Acidobacteriota bacterium]
MIYQKRSLLLTKTFILLFSIILLLNIQLFSGKKVIEKTDPALRLKWYQQHVSMKESSLFKNLPWQFIGPVNVSGRMTDVEVVAPKGKNYTIYVAGASGGVWKTENEGTTWKPIFEHAPSTSIGDIAIAPTDQNIIWVGTGEANIFRSSQAGAGIFRSDDAGKNWKNMGLTDTNTISRIIVHPKNPDIVYVAASGNEWTDNSERGIYKTTDGGKNWVKIKYINERTGASDLVMDPVDPDILYASFWQRIRRKWNDPRIEKGYKHSGIYRTTDGGKNWEPINKGLPLPHHRGRIGIDLCRSKPNVIYAFVDNYEIAGEWDEGVVDSYGRPKGGKIKGATVYRSDDSGLNWKQVSSNNDYMENLSSTYGWVFGQMRVDPNNENKIYVMGLALNLSEDGGKTFRRLRGMHGDHHGLWIDPDNSDYLVNVNDGGVAISYDGGKNFRTFYDNLPLVQFFNIQYDMADPFHVYGSVQDHGSYRSIVDLSKGRDNIPPQKWEGAPGGEGSNHFIDPTDTNTVYSAGFYGSLTRSNLKDKTRKLIVPKPPKGAEKYRGQWLAPFIISPHNPGIIYHGMNFLFRSMDRGDTWEKISPDLTYNKESMKGDIPYQTIFSISESPLKFGLIYAGTDDGRVHITKDSGRTWKEIIKGLPYRKWVSQLTASKYDINNVYMTQNGKRDDDFKAYVWKSTDQGKNWKDISSNIPCGPVNVIREDPKNSKVLYVGTDFGVYVTLNGGKNWEVLANNLPTTYVQDLVIHPRDNILVAGTHGRGVYAIDVSFIQEITPEITSSEIYLFNTSDAKLPYWRWWYWAGIKKANIAFLLKKESTVEVKIKDKNGKVIKRLKKAGVKGLNFIKWDLKPEKPQKKDPFVKEGLYQITVTGNGSSVKGKVKVTK